MMENFVIGLCLVTVFAMCSCGGDTNRFTDDRDGKTYRTVWIGNLTWMAENLNYRTENSWCYDDDNSNCEKYGRLYTWNAAMSSCPAGWRLPSDDDWDDLASAVGGVKRNRSDIAPGVVVWEVAGTKLKSKTGWSTGNRYIPGTDKFNFSALPGGCRWSDDSFRDVGLHGFWWSATDRGTSMFAQLRLMHYDVDIMGSYAGIKNDHAYSVRCVRD